MELTCPYTGERIIITRVYNIDTSLWKFYTGAWRRPAIELNVIDKCVVEPNKLLRSLDLEALGDKVSPRDYFNWLYEKVVEVNPHIRELVERETMERQD
jgi:hypothetical protein